MSIGPPVGRAMLAHESINAAAKAVNIKFLAYSSHFVLSGIICIACFKGVKIQKRMILRLFFLRYDRY